MSKTYIGIDPGNKGFISVQKDSKFEFISIAEHDLYELSDELSRIFNESDGGIACVMEDVHAIFGSSAKSTFEFGFNKGYLIGLLCANKIPYTLIAPKEWQKCIWTDSDKVYKHTGDKKVVDTKNTSINACKRLFPTIDRKRNSKCKNDDDNKVDSILMSEYARRNNL